MSGLVERLRFTAKHGVFTASTAGMSADYTEAADRIERLESALREIAETTQRKQLPITAQINERALEVLERT